MIVCNALLLNKTYFFSSFNKENRKDLKIDNRILKKSADQKPETAKPSINLSAIKIMIALITKIKSPKVTMVAGNVKKINNGLTIIFKIAITTATIIAAP